MQKPIRTIASVAVAALMASSAANAGSFSLYTEGSAAAIGNYGAGLAAEAADASIGWYNPAGLVLIRNQQAVFGGVGVFPSSKISGTSTFSTLIAPGVTRSYVQTFDHLQGAENGFVPSFHYALPLGENATFGLSMVAPFGLATSWPRTSAVRYEATQSRLATTNLSPELGGRINENFSIGGGIDLQYARVAFNQMIGSPVAMQLNHLPATYLDSMSYNKGTSFGVGFHAGIMAMFNDNHTRLGLNYQSQMKHKFNGYSRLTGRLAVLSGSGANILSASPNAVSWNNSLSSNNINLPEIATLSAYHDVNEKLALLGSVVYTGWSSLKTIELDGVRAYAPTLGQVVVNSISNLNYRNTWRFDLGANYHVNEKLMLRAGGGYDQTPTVGGSRDVRIPDANRWAAAIGAHYQYSPTMGFDAGYTHLFAADEARVNKTTVAGSTSVYNVSSTTDGHADLVGLQFTYTLDAPVIATK